MKKIIVLLMVALVAVALVACGGEAATTTEKPAVTSHADPVATTPATTTNEVPSTGATTTPTVNTTKTPGETTKTPNTTTAPETGIFPEGIDILYGEYEFAAIDATWNGIWSCAFEDHHPELDYKWCLVFKMLPTEGFVQEDLIAMDEESGFGIAFEDYTWTLIINGEEHVIETFCIPQRTGFIYVRMGLGDWAPEIGEHEYDIKLKITETGTDTIVYWAYMTDPEWGGVYIYDRKPPILVIPTDEVPDDVEQLPEGALTGISGPESLAATETYVKLFDGLARTKFCSSDYTNPLIFTVANASSLRGISLVGANDDEKFPERIPVKFKLYGSDDGSDGSWNLVLDVNKSVDDLTVTNYIEHYYAFTEVVDYTYFKFEIEDASGAATPKYQFSEILLYTDKQ